MVRDVVRARLADRVDAGHLRLPGSRPGPCAGCRSCRRPRTTPSATWSQARSRTRCGTGTRPARDPPVPAVLRDTRRDEPVRHRAVVPVPLGRGSGCCAVTCRMPRPRWPGSTSMGMSRPRRVPGVQESLLPRALQPGLEGRGRRHHRSGRRLAAADRDLRAAGLRVRRKDPDGRHLRRARATTGRPPSPSRGTTAVRQVQRDVLVGGGGDLLPGPQRSQEPIRSVASNPGACSSRGSCRPERAGGSSDG